MWLIKRTSLTSCRFCPTRTHQRRPRRKWIGTSHRCTRKKATLLSSIWDGALCSQASKHTTAMAIGPTNFCCLTTAFASRTMRMTLMSWRWKWIPICRSYLFQRWLTLKVRSLLRKFVSKLIKSIGCYLPTLGQFAKLSSLRANSVRKPTRKSSCQGAQMWFTSVIVYKITWCFWNSCRLIWSSNAVLSKISKC